MNQVNEIDEYVSVFIIIIIFAKLINNIFLIISF